MCSEFEKESIKKSIQMFQSKKKRYGFTAKHVAETIKMPLEEVAKEVSKLFSEGSFGENWVCQPVFNDGKKVFKVYRFIPSPGVNNRLFEKNNK